MALFAPDSARAHPPPGGSLTPRAGWAVASHGLAGAGLEAELGVARVHLLLTPTVAGQLPPVDGRGTIDGEPDDNWVRYTYPFNMTRSPAGTVCAGFTADGMPVGLQVVGPQHADVAVLRALALLEDLLALDPIAPFGAS